MFFSCFCSNTRTKKYVIEVIFHLLAVLACGNHWRKIENFHFMSMKNTKIFKKVAKVMKKHKNIRKITVKDGCGNRANLYLYFFIKNKKHIYNYSSHSKPLKIMYFVFFKRLWASKNSDFAKLHFMSLQY